MNQYIAGFVLYTYTYTYTSARYTHTHTLTYTYTHTHTHTLSLVHSDLASTFAARSARLNSWLCFDWSSRDFASSRVRMCEDVSIMFDIEVWRLGDRFFPPTFKNVLPQRGEGRGIQVQVQVYPEMGKSPLYQTGGFLTSFLSLFKSPASKFLRVLGKLKNSQHYFQ